MVRVIGVLLSALLVLEGRSPLRRLNKRRFSLGVFLVFRTRFGTPARGD
jgi:hypothetical protein